MPDPLDYAESDEDDLFDDPLFVDERQPIPGPSKPSPLEVQTAPAPLPEARLPASKAPSLPRAIEARGAPALRALCIRLLIVYASSITDIGTIPFSQLADVLAVLPREQLEVVELNSPLTRQHIRKESSDLWERYVRDDPRFRKHYATCLERQAAGKRARWRREYRDAEEADRARKEQAIARMAERYRALDEAKKQNKVIVVDKLIPTRLPKRTQPASQVPQAPQAKAAKTISKLRQDVKRESLARAHQAKQVALSAPSRTSTPSFSPGVPTASSSRLPATPAAAPALSYASPGSSTSLSYTTAPLLAPPTQATRFQQPVRFRIPGQPKAPRKPGKPLPAIRPVVKAAFEPPPPAPRATPAFFGDLPLAPRRKSQDGAAGQGSSVAAAGLKRDGETAAAVVDRDSSGARKRPAPITVERQSPGSPLLRTASPSSAGSRIASPLPSAAARTVPPSPSDVVFRKKAKLAPSRVLSR